MAGGQRQCQRACHVCCCPGKHDSVRRILCALPRAQRARLVGERRGQAGVHNLVVLVHVVRDAAARAAQRERRPDDERELADLVGQLRARARPQAAPWLRRAACGPGCCKQRTR